MQLSATPVLFCGLVGAGWGAGPAEKGMGVDEEIPVGLPSLCRHRAWGNGMYLVRSTITLRSPRSRFDLESVLRGVVDALWL